MSLSLICDQAVYMPAQIGSRKGYQVVAKSQGVTAEEVGFLESYGIPIALNPEAFAEGRRLFRLPSGRIGFNYLSNMGVGYDGRFGAIYSRTIIVEENQFTSLRADPRIFESLFTQNPKEPGSLARLELRGPLTDQIDFDVLRETLHDKDALARALGAIFGGKKLILLAPPKEDLRDFMANLILLLPDEMRLIPYTTYCVEPDRESQFTLFVVPAGERHKLPQAGAWEVIALGSKDDAQAPGSSSDPAKSLSELTFDGDLGAIQDFHSKFLRYPRTSGVMPRLEYWCLESKLAKAKSPEEAIDVTLALAERGLSPELSEQFYSDAVNRAARLGDPSRISRAYTSRLSASKSDDDLLGCFEEGLDSLLRWPAEAAKFAIYALAVGKGRGREAVFSEIMALPSGGPDKTKVLVSMLGNPSFRAEWLQRAKSGVDLRVIPRVVLELSLAGSAQEAMELIRGTFSGAGLSSDPSKQNVLIAAMVNSSEAKRLPPKVKIDMDGAAMALVKEELRSSRAETTGRAVDVTIPLGCAAAAFGVSFVVYLSTGEHLLPSAAFFVGSALWVAYVLASLSRRSQGRQRAFVWSKSVGDPDAFARSLTQNAIDPILNSLSETKGQTKDDADKARIERLSAELTALKASVQATAKR